MDDARRTLRQAPVPGTDILGGASGSIRGQTQQTGEGSAVQTV